MQQDTEISPERRDYVAPVDQGAGSASLLRTLVDRLRQLEFEVPLHCGAHSHAASGVPLRLAIPELLQPVAGSGSAIKAIRSMLRANTPFTLSLSEPGGGDTAIHALQRCCEILRAEVANSGRNGGHVGICIQPGQISLQALRLITNSVPGAGPRYVLLDDSQMTAPANGHLRSQTDKNWDFLWRDRLAAAPLRPAYGAVVRTPCPLLDDEVAASILPVYGIPVPADSAWFPLGLALPRFTDDAGEISWDRLLRTLTCGVELVDKFMDRLHWSRPAQMSDARLNRRLAISITGLGDLVLRRGLDPQDLAALRWLSAIVLRIRKKLWYHSAQMARNHGCLPALRRSDPSSGWDDSVHRDTWRHHWRVALEKSAVRHRNMLVLSPYSVLPSERSCDAAFTDLLPAIACADAWSFADVPQAGNWNLSEYKAFHKRAWAVMQGRKTGTLVAAGV
jgi:hypothetical protein